MANIDKELLKILIDQEDELDFELEKLRKKFGREIRRQGSKINDESKIQKLTPVLIAGFIASLTNLLSKTNVGASEAIGKRDIGVLSKLMKGIKDPQANILLKTFEKEVRAYTSQVHKTIFTRKVFKNRTLSSRILSLKSGSTKTVRNIIHIGVSEGKSTIEIARQVEQYIKPKGKLLRVSPWKWYKERFPSYRVSDLKNIPPGSVSYNSFMIARTETAFTYRNTTVELNKNEPWAKGFIWNLSASHPVFDICDDWAAGSPYKAGNLPDGHPNGLCHVTTAIASKKEMRRYIKGGKVPKKIKGKPAITQKQFAKKHKKKKTKEVKKII